MNLLEFLTKTKILKIFSWFLWNIRKDVIQSSKYKKLDIKFIKKTYLQGKIDTTLEIKNMLIKEQMFTDYSKEYPKEALNLNYEFIHYKPDGTKFSLYIKNKKGNEKWKK